MRVLVTGGAGFVGSHVVEHFVKEEEDVSILDNLSRAEVFGLNSKVVAYNWNYIKKNFPKVKVFKGDIRDFDALKKAAKDVDAIIHTAAQVAVTTSLKDPRMDFDVNAIGTFNVLEVARNSKTNPSIVYCSTNKVYGANVNRIPTRKLGERYCFDEKFRDGIPEDYPIDLCEHTPYGCSKLAGDLYVQDYAHTYGLKTGVFRMSCIYGERQFGVEDQGWVAWFAIATLLGKPITIYGDGRQVRDVLYVGDLIRAYDSFLNSELKSEVFNMGGGPENTLSLLELLTMLEESTGRKPKISYSSWRPGDQKVYVSNIKKAREALDWKPEVNPREGIDRLVSWVQGNLVLLSNL